MLRKGVGWKMGILRASNANATLWLALSISRYHLNDRTTPKISPPTTCTRPTLERYLKVVRPSKSKGEQEHFNYHCSWSMVLSSLPRVLIICFFASSSSRAVSGIPPTFHLQLAGPPLLPARNPAPPLRRTFPHRFYPPASKSSTSTAHPCRISVTPDARKFPATL